MARYVGIIVDGNGRWAQARGLGASDGHRAGAKTLQARLRDALEFGIRELTIFGFSTENWSRPPKEVDGLMSILSGEIAGQVMQLHHEGVRLRFIGREHGIDRSVIRQMRNAESLTCENRRMTVCIAFNYGGRAEIVDAARRFDGGTEEEFRRCLYAPDMHDLDVIIRTGDDQRLSNFLLWQSAYSEFIVRGELWPEFSRTALQQALAEFVRRRRRCGERALDAHRGRRINGASSVGSEPV